LDFYDILSKFSFLNVIKQLTLKMFKSSIIVIILGSFLFLFAAFWVPTSRVFGEPEAAKRLEIILNNKISWDVVQGLFGAGAIITAIGMGLMAYSLQKLNYSWLLNIAALLLITGSLFWIWHLYLRAVDPYSFAYRLQPWWHFAVYTILTQIGIILVGYFLWQSPFPNWIGWMLMAGMTVLFLLTILFLDMPPFVYYLFLLIASMSLWRKHSLIIKKVIIDQENLHF
jgi:hypothetical protein